MYISLARKYRPKNFASVAVQTHVSSTLKGAIARGRVAHGYLLCGPRGVGKTTLARVLAMALNCERRRAGLGTARDSGLGRVPAAGGRVDSGAVGPSPESPVPSPDPSPDAGEPCGECASCVRIWGGSSSLDVVEIDAASNRGVDDARELRERAMYAPSTEGSYKVYIVDEAHMLTREAWNALLKVLEEPPPRVVFVFATTEPQKIAQTAAPVLSRLQRFDLKRIGPSEVRERLAAVLDAERVQADPEAVALIARAADGSLRDALSLADQVLSLGDGALTVARVREALGLVAEDEYLGLLELIAERRAAEIFPAVARVADAGVDLGSFLAGLADMLRAQLALVLGGTAPELSEATRAALEARRNALSAGDLLRMLSAITELEPRFRRSGQQRLLLEALLLRFALMDRTVSLEEVLRGLGAQTASAGADAPPQRGREGAAGLGGGGRESLAAEEGQREEGRRGAPLPGPTPMAARASSPGESAPVVEPADADRSGRTPGPAIDLSGLLARWSEIVEQVRVDRGGLLAVALPNATPVAVSTRGDITLEVDGSNEIYERAIDSGAASVLSAVGARFSGVGRLLMRRAESAPSTGAPRRLTEEAIKSERLATLRARDPALDAAVDALDLELLD